MSDDLVDIEDASDGENVEEPQETEPVDDDEVEPTDEKRKIQHNHVYEKEIRVQLISDRRTSDMLQQTEYAHLLSVVTEYVSRNGIDEIKGVKEIVAGITDPIIIAEKIITARLCPFKIRRYRGITGGIKHYEDWDPNTMVHY